MEMIIFVEDIAQTLLLGLACLGVVLIVLFMPEW